MTAPEHVLTLTEAAKLIRVSPKTMGEMARRHRVPAQKVGREWRFLRSALEEWLAGGATAAADRHGAAAGVSGVAEPIKQYELPFAGFGDTAFSDNRERCLHRWVPWIAGFSSSFVAGVLNEVRTNGRRLCVLDPFAGVGTTLVEALTRGDEAVGFEINPYAALACKVKTEVAHYDVDKLAEAIERFDEYSDDQLWDNVRPSSQPPPAFQSRVPFFSRNIEPQVLACMDFVRDEPTDWIRDILRLALGSVMVSFSNYSYEPSLGTRAGAGKPNVENADVPGIVKRKLWDICEDIVDFQRQVASSENTPSATVHPLSYLKHSNLVPRHSVDALITSPPYLNNYHYIRNTRPQLYWLGLVGGTADLKIIEHQSFGQFWQTVRTGPVISVRPRLQHLRDQVDQLRGHNAEKGAYGGPGWANYAASYFNDCQKFCKVTRPLMRVGGTVVVVIGNNILQGMEFKTDEIFAEIAQAEGFKVVDLHLVRTKRTGNSVVNSSVRVGTVSKRTRLYETAVELRCP